jgi:hypothetical protein
VAATLEPEIEDITSPTVQKALGELQRLESRLSWARPITQVGALVCSFWLLYRVFEARGFLPSFLAFVGLSFVYRFGVSPMFAVAAGFLCSVFMQ